jgi:hypothetical protein
VLFCTVNHLTKAKTLRSLFSLYQIKGLLLATEEIYNYFLVLFYKEGFL